MGKYEEVEDSLEFCKDIDFYEMAFHEEKVNDRKYPHLEEYIHENDKSEKATEQESTIVEKLTHHKNNHSTGVDNVIKLVEYQEEQSKKGQGNHKADPVTQLPKEEVKQEKSKPSKKTSKKTEEIEEEKELNSLTKEIIRLVCTLLVAVAIVFSVTTFLGTYTRVKGSSMEPTLHNKDMLIIDKLTYRTSDPKQFDIIVFEHSKSEWYIKRIIGLPGQTVQIKDGKAYINGNELKDSYGLEPMDDAGQAAEPIQLGEDEYFVLGDNRNDSADSRMEYVGVVKRDKIIGKCAYRFFPFDSFGKIDHK
ncbi:signal peptidase I [Lachnospiraceae bacterium KM106-2]|nr:signal peptidase I [Lachnospiraceae bacterium KM106-2]